MRGEVGGPLDAHAARAALVDYIADCRRAVDLPATDHATATALAQVVTDLTNLVRRWDIAPSQQP